MLRRDWPVPARMGFAVNRSQLVQSEWKETAQKGYFVSATVCEADTKTKHNRGFFLPTLLGCTTFNGDKLTWDLAWLWHHIVDTLCRTRATLLQPFNVAVDVNIALCLAFVFLNSIQWPEMFPDTNMSSRAFQAAFKQRHNLCEQRTEAESHSKKHGIAD